jgi:hypothetical protein
VSIPADRNVTQKEVEKNIKTQEFMWNVKCVIVPIMNGTIGIVTKKVLRKNLEDIPGKNSVHSLKNTSMFGTSHKTEVLQSEI